MGWAEPIGTSPTHWFHSTNLTRSASTQVLVRTLRSGMRMLNAIPQISPTPEANAAIGFRLQICSSPGSLSKNAMEPTKIERPTTNPTGPTTIGCQNLLLCGTNNVRGRTTSNHVGTTQQDIAAESQTNPMAWAKTTSKNWMPVGPLRSVPFMGSAERIAVGASQPNAVAPSERRTKRRAGRFIFVERLRSDTTGHCPGVGRSA